jgi:hypothetical protein
MLQALPNNDLCLQSHCLTTDLYVIVTCLCRLDSPGSREKVEELPREILQQAQRQFGSEEGLSCMELHTVSPQIKLTTVHNVCLPPVAGLNAVEVYDPCDDFAMHTESRSIWHYPVWWMSHCRDCVA